MKRIRLLALALLCSGGTALAETVLRVAPHSNLTILDPVWTTAYITRNHGYLIYDTLFGTDEAGAIKPQMGSEWNAAPDGRSYTFTLREGLRFHDGAPVTSEDVIASLERWGKRDALGQELFAVTERWQALTPRQFRLHLKEPYGLVLESLGKPSSNVPFIMPKRVAQTPADKQLDDNTGSGPFIFLRAEWKPGERIVYRRNPDYRPRAEPPSGTTGGKRALVDRVEWHIIKDPQTQVNALLAGEIDLVEALPFELYASIKADSRVRIVDPYPPGFQLFLRLNHLHPPFDDVRVRRAALAAINQTLVLRAQVGTADLYRVCPSFYPCRAAGRLTNSGLEPLARFDAKTARQLLRQSNYAQQAIVLLQQTDLAPIAKVPLVVAQLLRQAGFKVDVQAMDWQTLVARRAKREPPAKGGWNAFATWVVTGDLSNPVGIIPLNAACDKAWFGWPCDAAIQQLRQRYSRTLDAPTRQALAERIHARAAEVVTHIPLGEFNIPAAMRSNVSGLVRAPALLFWGIEKR